MTEQDDTPDVTRDPATGRITVNKAGTYRISAPLVNARSTWVGGPRDGQPVMAEELKQMTEPLFTDAEHAAAWRKERIAVLETALHALVDEDGDDDTYAGLNECPSCYSYGWGRIRDMTHTAGCPWVVARALLKGES